MNETATETSSLVQTLLDLPVFESEWVLWLLLGLSVISIAVIIERVVFYQRHAVDADQLRTELSRSLDKGDFQSAAAALKRRDSLETNAVLAGLVAYEKGPESVEDLIAGALGRERTRYERRLGFLATLASNAPYIGLFGTVLGIIRSFRDLSTNMAEASDAVMAGIAEALLATAVGLLVAIPAVIAYNVFKAKVKEAASDCETLARVLLSNLKAVELDRRLGRLGDAGEETIGGRGRRRRGHPVRHQRHPVRQHRPRAPGHLHAHVGGHHAGQPQGGAPPGGHRRRQGRVDGEPGLHRAR